MLLLTELNGDSFLHLLKFLTNASGINTALQAIQYMNNGMAVGEAC
jgi:hypothetical protein